MRVCVCTPISVIYLILFVYVCGRVAVCVCMRSSIPISGSKPFPHSHGYISVYMTLHPLMDMSLSASICSHFRARVATHAISKQRQRQKYTLEVRQHAWTHRPSSKKQLPKKGDNGNTAGGHMCAVRARMCMRVCARVCASAYVCCVIITLILALILLVVLLPLIIIVAALLTLILVVRFLLRKRPPPSCTRARAGRAGATQVGHASCECGGNRLATVCSLRAVWGSVCA